ncbi:hypothetical protein [Papillibacter cinnamivorans]|uniref:Uncharacterized protein n=1 Tax=Papillibacter cinnamivorans DSM 12816 TaxID=1122930 RepID=A0A1W2CNE3_9FIRM|nr:hypothetical protein [Papillibacter cinnamivorans]SMC86730.1 hypothetical protein SAMN02745168_0107 [Papillibacter cinnamivorans DSM 12816]
MNREEIEIQRKCMEDSIASISAKVADAVKLAQLSAALSADSEARLVQAALELEELYISLNSAAPENS